MTSIPVLHRITIALATCLLWFGVAATAFAQPTTQPVSSTARVQPTHAIVYERDDVNMLMKRVMDFQIRAYGDKPRVNWQAGAFWSGVTACYTATKDPDFYTAARKWGDAVNYKLNVGPSTYHCDSIAVGHAYLDLYAKDKDPRMIAHLGPLLDKYAAAKTITKGESGRAPNITDDKAPFIGRNVFWWCDALFMGPPVFARYAALTGDKKYSDLMHSLYWDSTAFLFDPSEALFYRDANYFPQKRKSPTGKKIFWSRGNGWVFAGLILTLDALPDGDKQKSKYVELFKQMTPAIVKHQGQDGMWRPSINEPTWYSMPESSGSAFFTYGLLAGINRGYLDRATYLPIAMRGWNALVSNVNKEGMLGWAQKEGAAPGETDANTFKDYAHGAFLLAGSEVWKMNLTAKDIAGMKKG